MSERLLCGTYTYVDLAGVIAHTRMFADAILLSGEYTCSNKAYLMINESCETYFGGWLAARKHISCSAAQSFVGSG